MTSGVTSWETKDGLGGEKEETEGTEETEEMEGTEETEGTEEMEGMRAAHMSAATKDARRT